MEDFVSKRVGGSREEKDSSLIWVGLRLIGESKKSI